MSRVDRRTFLTRSARVLGAAGAAALVDSPAAGAPRRRPATADDRGRAPPRPAPTWPRSEPFEGVHQAGILNPAPAPGDVRRARLVRARPRDAPAGAAGAQPARPGAHRRRPDPAARDRRAARRLGDARARQRARRADGHDRLRRLAVRRALRPGGQAPARAHDDADLPGRRARPGTDPRRRACSRSAPSTATRSSHTLRELLRTVRGSFQLRWIDRRLPERRRGPTPKSNPRNLFAFRDGTANPPTEDAALMNQLVWAGRRRAGLGRRRHLPGGAHHPHARRVLGPRRPARAGEHDRPARDTGAPLGGTDEFEDPRYDLDPKGDRIPLDAHIRLANPRTATTETNASAPRLQLPPRLRQGRPARPGPGVHRLQPEPQPPVRRRSSTGSTASR